MSELIISEIIDVKGHSRKRLHLQRPKERKRGKKGQVEQ